ncbi:MAG: class I SAM-dependent methyltransferase [Ferruginibacter sp.]
MIHYTHCPVCASEKIVPQLAAEDFTVSHQQFSIWHCNHCTHRFTQDIPEQEAIGPYYKSDAYISHSDTKKGLINTLYHMVRKRTLNGKRKMVVVATGTDKGAILDIGCGTGAFLHTMKTAGWKTTGLEPDETAREKATALYGLQPMEPGELFKMPSASFNAITMWHVLEHVHQLHDYIKQLSQLLAPGGKIFIAVPNYTSKDAGIYNEYWAAYDVPRHLYHFSPASMRQLINGYGLRVTTVKPMWFDSFYVSMLSEQYKNGKGNIIRACWNGLLSNCKALLNKERCSSVIYIIEKTGS